MNNELYLKKNIIEQRNHKIQKANNYVLKTTDNNKWVSWDDAKKFLKRYD